MSAGAICLPGDRYEFVDTILGEGLQGQVHMGRDRTNDDQIAIKFINKSEMDQKNLDRFHTEIKIMEELSHPNVVSLKAYLRDYMLPTNAGGNGKPWGAIVMEYCPFDMFDYLMVEGRFDETLSRTYFTQLLSGLQACHRAGVFHRDIKPENLLLDSNFQLKLADFGLATVVPEAGGEGGGSSALLYSYCGSNAYMAPEVYASQSYEGTHADLWSAACVLFVMITGLQPFSFPGPTDWWMDKINRNRHAKFWEAHCQSAPFMRDLDAARDIINKMFVATPAARLTLAATLEHPWMDGDVHSSGHLCEVMREKEARVSSAKAEERERKAAEKARKAAQEALRSRTTAGRAGAGAFKNAFERNTHRALDVPAAPLFSDADASLPGGVALASRPLWDFYSSLDSSEALLAVERGLRHLDPSVQFSVDPASYIIRVGMLQFPGAVVGEGDEAETLPAVALQGTIRLYTHRATGKAQGQQAEAEACTFVRCMHGLLPEGGKAGGVGAAGAGAGAADAGVFSHLVGKAAGGAGGRALGDVFTFTRLVASLKENVATAENAQGQQGGTATEQNGQEQGAAEGEGAGEEVPLPDELDMV